MKLLLAAVALAGCSDAGYRIEIVLPDDHERSRVGSVELVILRPDGCKRVGGSGEEPAAEDSVRAIRFRPAAAAEPVGHLDAGRWGFSARIRDSICRVVLAGCTEASLDDGGAGTIRVEVEHVAGLGCPPGEVCTAAGHCEGPCDRDADCDDHVGCTRDRCPPGQIPDAGGLLDASAFPHVATDASLDAAVEASLDASLDAPADSGPQCEGGPVVETCDSTGLDEDCDGLVDERDPDAADACGGGESCTRAAGAAACYFMVASHCDFDPCPVGYSCSHTDGPVVNWTGLELCDLCPPEFAIGGPCHCHICYRSP